jgi:hypothetical protein
MSVDFGREMTKQSLQIRSCLGVIKGELIVMLLLPPCGRVGLARMGLEGCEVYF